MRQIYFGSVNDFFAGLIATRYADGLRAMVGLVAAGASGFAGLRAAAILGLRQFVSRVIDYVPVQASGRSGHLKTLKARGEHDDRDQQQQFEQPAGEHSAIREDADGRFSGKGFWSAGER